MIVGAGPTGLVLALWLTRLGIAVRVLDKNAEPGTTSRAMAVQARTLEFYGQLGFADAVVEQGRWATEANIWANGKQAAHINFGGMGEGISPYPYPLIYPQDEHERLLIERLKEIGVTVERNTELLSFNGPEEGRVRVKIKKIDGSEEICLVSYVAGCDGAHSQVRQILGIGFPGGIYEHLFYVADVEATGQTINGGLHISLEPSDFLVVFPMKGEGHARFIGTVRNSGQADEKVSWEDVSKGVIERLQADVRSVNWFSTYHVHHRVADHFRKGRIFLLGDAAHIHSPVGGQGMNTGIGDAVNLAWKLAAVLRGRAKVPILAPLLVSFRMVRRGLFRTVSQTALNYRESSLNAGSAGSVHGGDRLPWVKMNSKRNWTDNFAPLTSLDWQIHVYGKATPAVRALCTERGLPLHVFPWQTAMKKASLRRNALYLVRPDGYIALADAQGNAATLQSYLDERGVLLGK